MTKKEIFLQNVINHYLNSKDFNGLPIYTIENYNPQLACELINEGLLEAYSDKEVVNPHIRNCFYKIPQNIQIHAAQDIHSHTVLFPTKSALSTIETDNNKPFTAMMQKGATHFDVLYFNIEILEKYANNPKFTVYDCGYRGEIIPKDDETDEEISNEYIKNWGMAYALNSEKKERAVCAFVADLARLDETRQSLWKGFLLLKQENYIFADGFYTNLVLGEWIEEVWVFDAILECMKTINEECQVLEIPCLFNKLYGNSKNKKHDSYRNIFLPTLKNYNDFVMALEIMIIHNISFDTFQKDAYGIKKVERKKIDKNGKESFKGSLEMLSEWLKINIKSPHDTDEIIIKPLGTIRKLRQKPAHEINPNEYDLKYYDMQTELLFKTYFALDALMQFLYLHPYAKKIKFPEIFKQGTKIVNF